MGTGSIVLEQKVRRGPEGMGPRKLVSWSLASSGTAVEPRRWRVVGWPVPWDRVLGRDRKRRYSCRERSTCQELNHYANHKNFRSFVIIAGRNMLRNDRGAREDF